MTAKQASERMAAFRKRRQESGLKRLEMYAHPDDHEAIKETAAKLQRKRDKAAKRGDMTAANSAPDGQILSISARPDPQ
jgi:hypothetical protein